MPKLKWSLVIFALFASLVVGCKSDEDDDSSTSGSVVPGVIDAVGGFNVKVKPPDGTNYFIHKSGDFDAACVVASNETVYANKDINCIVEVEELEGAFHGISMVMNAPPNMCKYVLYYPYIYFGRDYGSGPTAVTAVFDADGDFVSAGSSITGPGYFNADGTAICNYDYTPTQGPDCCIGSYTLTKTTPTATTIESKEWTGKPGNCAVTPAEEVKRDDLDNFPIPIYYFSLDGFNKEFATKKRSFIDYDDSSLYYANYYTGTAPAAFKLTTSPVNEPTGHPYYQWLCLDDAEEIIARIRVQIREWNDIDEFLLEGAGNPDTTGTETDWGTNINDFKDWLDIFTSGDGFPGMPKE